MTQADAQVTHAVVFDYRPAVPMLLNSDTTVFQNTYESCPARLDRGAVAIEARDYSHHKGMLSTVPAQIWNSSIDKWSGPEKMVQFGSKGTGAHRLAKGIPFSRPSH
jgi:hypothetical protein